MLFRRRAQASSHIGIGPADRARALLSAVGEFLFQGRSFAAPWWRKLTRAALILGGLVFFIVTELWIADKISAGQYYYIIVLFVLAVSVIISVVRPTAGFMLWFGLSQFVRLFSASLPKRYNFDTMTLGVLLIIAVMKFFADRQPPKKLNIPEWLLVLSFIYASFIRTQWNGFDVLLAMNLLQTPLVVYFIAKGIIKKKEHIAWMLVLIAITGSIWALMGIYEQYSGHMWLSAVVGRELALGYQSGGDTAYGRSTGPAGQYYVYGNYLILTVLIAFHLAGWTRKPAMRAIYYLLCPITIVGLYYGYSKAPYIAFLFSLLFMLLMARGGLRRYITAIMCLSVVLAVFLPIAFTRSQFRRRMITTPYARMATNVTSMNMWREHFLIGVGVNKYQENVPKYISSRLHSFSQEPNGIVTTWGRPHNEYFLIAAEQGLIGALLYFGAIFGFIATMFRVRSELPAKDVLGKDMVASFIAFIFGVLITMLTDEFQNWPFMYIVMYTVMAMVVRLSELHRTDAQAAVPQAVPAREVSSVM